MKQVAKTSSASVIDAASAIAERIEMLTKVVVLGIDNENGGDLELSGADAYEAASMIVDLVRQQRQLIGEIEISLN
ncbi:hypothetical protein IMCC21906_00018 [Spongiibacter sp. IMCC21906]|uniref:hypothetical protein n=1 Tax=Spongiibacter sp. IMCC21906 TaxID=1620392 RepID=UPI00062E0A4A|nr:hypothetical protein [Spongiibacter sp. IMCC21906]AKH67713.1 hypothetical protein IMCC21906_00018 [Spongiibacter sp. IMCC21906]